LRTTFAFGLITSKPWYAPSTISNSQGTPAARSRFAHRTLSPHNTSNEPMPSQAGAKPDKSRRRANACRPKRLFVNHQVNGCNAPRSGHPGSGERRSLLQIRRYVRNCPRHIVLFLTDWRDVVNGASLCHWRIFISEIDISKAGSRRHNRREIFSIFEVRNVRLRTRSLYTLPGIIALS